MTMFRTTAIMATLLLAACGGNSEPTVADGKVAASTMAAAAAAGSIAGAATGLGVSTDDLPDFAELPPGAKAIHNMKMNDGGKIGGSISLETRQTPAELIAFYKQVFARHGLTIGVETQSANMAMLNGQSADESKMLQIMINPNVDGPTALNIVHARKTG